jgi:hypothetical protein
MFSEFESYTKTITKKKERASVKTRQSNKNVQNVTTTS